MKHIFTWLTLTLVVCIQSKAQSIPTPLLDIEFNKNGIVLGGTDAANHKADVYNTVNAHILHDPIKDKYYGCTNYTADGYYYVSYEATDNLGKAFQKEVTWEVLYRIDNLKANSSATNGTHKFFSSQEGGGWGLMYGAGSGFRLEYVTTGNNIHYIMANKDQGVTGRFYHIVATVNRSTNLANLYVNGEQVTKDFDLGTDPFLFGNFGSPAREKNMWLCLGGDNASSTAPRSCQNSTRGTFVYAKIYGKELSAENVSEIYNTPDVKYYTEPTKPTVYNDLIMDAVFGKDGTATDKSPYQATIGTNRKPKTQYNNEQKRYESTVEKASAFNFFYRDYFYDPSITKQLGDAFSFEIYCKSPGVFTDYTCPLMNQQDGGFGFEFSKTTGNPYFICNTAGYTSSMAAGKGSNKATTTADTEYNHYVCVFDRLNHKTHLYINGKLHQSITMNKGDNLCFPYQAYGWFGIMADTRANFTHDSNDYPFDGQMSIARVWGKALTTNEVSELYDQATKINTEVQIDETGLAPLCLPYNAIVPQNMVAYVPTKQEGNNVTFDVLATAGEVIEYGTPFLLKGEQGLYNVDIANADAKTKVATSNLMEGSFISKDINAYTLTSNGTTIVLTHDANACFAEKAAFIPYPTNGAETLNMVFTANQVEQPVVIVPDSVTGNNVYGRITCNGSGVANVKVSDGFEIVKTDKNGYYSFRSEKKNGYVFYSLPSGYVPFQGANATREDKIFIPFWQTFKNASPAVAEEHNFELQVENNDEFYYVAGADSHLANRYNDLVQFHQGYIESLKKEKANADNVPIYSTILGDNAWDSYWYGQNFSLKNFRSTLAEYDYALPLFPCMGNHDNDGATPYDENTDFEASAPFRTFIAPNYYSYNLGKIHFITMDDIFYINSGNPSGTACVGSRNYKGFLTKYQLDWIKKDLEDVDKNTPIIFQAHIPVWMRNTTVLDSCQAYLVYNNAVSSDSLGELVKDFKTVHVITGHTHYNYHVHPEKYPNIHENNIAAICAIWWYSGYISGWHNCRDGVPGGYEVFHINGTDIQYQYHSIENNGNGQFHVLDINTVKEYYNTEMSSFLAKYTAFTNFGKWDDNQLLINVFNYDEDWKIEVLENGTPQKAERLYVEDPYHILTYDMPWFKNGSALGTDARATKNTHMFKVQCATATSPVRVRVTDSFGNVYEQNIERPMAFDLNVIPTETQQTVTAIDEKTYRATHTANIYTNNGKIYINADEATICQIIEINGKSQTHKLAAGSNVFDVNTRGIYIVKVNNTIKKLFVK